MRARYQERWAEASLLRDSRAGGKVFGAKSDALRCMCRAALAREQRGGCRGERSWRESRCNSASRHFPSHGPQAHDGNSAIWMLWHQRMASNTPSRCMVVEYFGLVEAAQMLGGSAGWVALANAAYSVG